MPTPDDAKKKGFFGIAKLAIAKNYVFPDRRRAMMRMGGAACLALLAYFLVDFFLLKSSFTASGPLSSYHATFEKDCGRCHEKAGEVTNDQCSVCHEKAGAKAESTGVRDDQAIYTFSAHYIYRAMDFSRVAPAMEKHGDRETACYACHPEHLGRQAKITDVPDQRCIVCHEYGSFNKKHPEFDFVVDEAPDDSTLKFTHVRHVKEVLVQENLKDVERACLYCHNPQPDGKHFALIEYDQHCGSCHLTSNIGTPRLPIKGQSDDPEVGVETLQMIRARAVPGGQWAFFSNENEFNALGSKVSKKPLYHEDPWVLENLKSIRRQLYPELEFADLLKTSGKLASQSRQTLNVAIYQEALQTLRTYATGLRGRPEPEVRDDLARLDSLLKVAQSKLQGQINSVAGPKFMPQPALLNPGLNRNQAAALKNLALELTKPCQKCHVVSDASLQRVAKDQRMLQRAEFDHRAHILERRCLDCHTEIPILKTPSDTAKVNNLQYGAFIQNLPPIANCRACHNAAESSNRCVTCHYFHPNKTQRASLSLYLD